MLLAQLQIHKNLLCFSIVLLVGTIILVLDTECAFHTVFIKVITEPSSLKK